MSETETPSDLEYNRALRSEILDVAARLEGDGAGNGAPITTIIEQVCGGRDSDYMATDTLEQLPELIRRGEVYQPSPGHLRVT